MQTLRRYTPITTRPSGSVRGASAAGVQNRVNGQLPPLVEVRQNAQTATTSADRR